MRRVSVALLFLCFFAPPSHAADNELTPEERKDGWMLLFDGKTYDGWMTSEGKASKRPIETARSTRIVAATT